MNIFLRLTSTYLCESNNHFNWALNHSIWKTVYFYSKQFEMLVLYNKPVSSSLHKSPSRIEPRQDTVKTHVIYKRATDPLNHKNVIKTQSVRQL